MKLLKTSAVDKMTVYYRLLAHEHLPDFKVNKQWRQKIQDRPMKKAIGRRK
jgi:hypothetical protein